MSLMCMAMANQARSGELDKLDPVPLTRWRTVQGSLTHVFGTS